MKPEVSLKYIQYLRSQKSEQEGFTLIELLIVIIIIGILVAVALPNLLNQIGKARETELKNAVGTVNRSQKAYRFERQTFSGSLSRLGISIPAQYIDNTSSMIVDVSSAAASVVPANNEATNDGTRAYSGRISFADGEYAQILCQSNDIATQLAAPTGTGSNLACPAAISVEIQ